MVAFVNLHAARAVVAGVEYAIEKRELQRPSGLRLRTAITARMVSLSQPCGASA